MKPRSFTHPIPKEIVSKIKSIIYMDRRERRAAGYKYGSRKLHDRIAAYYGISVYSVRSIMSGRRHKGSRADRHFCFGITVTEEYLTKVRQRRGIGEG